MSVTTRDDAILEALTWFTRRAVLRARSRAMAAAMTAQRKQDLNEVLAAEEQETRTGGLTLLATTGGTWQVPAMPVYDPSTGYGDGMMIPVTRWVARSGTLTWDEAGHLLERGIITPDQARIMTAGTTGPPASASPGGDLMLPATRQANQEATMAKDEAAAKDKARAKGGKAAPRAPRLNLEGRIKQELSEPLGMDQADLDEIFPYGQAAPGMCRDCLTARARPGGTRCWYCGKAAELRQAAGLRQASQDALEHSAWSCSCGHASRREHQVATGTRPSSRAVLVPALATSLAFFWLALHGEAFLVFPAFAFLLVCAVTARKPGKKKKSARKGSPGGRGW